MRILRVAGPLISKADVVHVHSNGLLAETAGLIADRRGKPVVLTLYGTEIWHYRPQAGTRRPVHAALPGAPRASPSTARACSTARGNSASTAPACR